MKKKITHINVHHGFIGRHTLRATYALTHNSATWIRFARIKYKLCLCLCASAAYGKVKKSLCILVHVRGAVFRSTIRLLCFDVFAECRHVYTVHVSTCACEISIHAREHGTFWDESRGIRSRNYKQIHLCARPHAYEIAIFRFKGAR